MYLSVLITLTVLNICPDPLRWAEKVKTSLKWRCNSACVTVTRDLSCLVESELSCALLFQSMTCYIKVHVNLTCLRTRTVRVRTRSIDVNARHNFVMHAHDKANVTHEKKKQFVWAGRAPCGLAQTENVCGRITAGVTHYHDFRIRWAREKFLVLFFITPPC